MFTGIIQSLGRVRSLDPTGAGCVLQVELGTLGQGSTLQPGDSVAVNGTCLTVTELAPGIASFDVSAETLEKCLIGSWQVGNAVNLEPALTLQTPLGGHLVTGHVDGTGVMAEREDHGGFTRMTFDVPRSLGRFIASKGSVAVDGISLTSNDVNDRGDQTRFDVALVPHTLAQTTLGTMQAGDTCHIEIDPVARYLDRFSQQAEH